MGSGVDKTRKGNHHDVKEGPGFDAEPDSVLGVS